MRRAASDDGTRGVRSRLPHACAALLAIGTGAVAFVAATVTAAGATPTGDSTQGVRNGEWIAYSTAPYGARPSTIARRNWGSDIFLVRQGDQPILVAGRRAGRTWNGCPTFSPDGTKLAFGTKTPGGKSVTVVRVSHAGASGARRVRMRVVRGDDRLVPCPLWSSDGSRLAYMSAGKVVVRRLDGSSPRRAVGDPVIQDFRERHADSHSLTSPTGDLVARRGVFPCPVVVERPDGSHRRQLPVGCLGLYAVAAWSPDGRKLLLMRDVSGWHFTMIAVSVKPPFRQVSVVEHVRVPNSHTWPGRGDVSWQPRPTK